MNELTKYFNCYNVCEITDDYIDDNNIEDNLNTIDYTNFNYYLLNNNTILL